MVRQGLRAPLHAAQSREESQVIGAAAQVRHLRQAHDRCGALSAELPCAELLVSHNRATCVGTRRLTQVRYFPSPRCHDFRFSLQMKSRSDALRWGATMRTKPSRFDLLAWTKRVSPSLYRASSITCSNRTRTLSSANRRRRTFSTANSQKPAPPSKRTMTTRLQKRRRRKQLMTTSELAHRAPGDESVSFRPFT